MRLDLLHQHAAEDVAPGVVVGDADAGVVARGRGERAVGSRRQRRQQIDAGVALEGLRDRQPLGRGERIDRCGPRNANCARAGRSAASARMAAQSSISAS